MSAEVPEFQRPPQLRDLQALFWQLLTAPEGVSKGVAELRRKGELESEDLSFLVRPDARLGPVERLDIYADMYFYRLRDCLAEDFPKVLALIGDARFHNLVTDYLLANPSSHFSLREVGRALPGFVATHPLTSEIPLLPDLARLEWARLDVFDEVDSEPLSRQMLLEKGSTHPKQLPVTLIASARLIRVDASVLALWKRLHGGEGTEGSNEPSLGRSEDRGVCVWRKGFAVLHRALSEDEEGCLEALASIGATLSELGEILLEKEPPSSSHHQTAQRLAEFLDLWTRDGLLTSHT